MVKDVEKKDVRMCGATYAEEEKKVIETRFNWKNFRNFIFSVSEAVIHFFFSFFSFFFG